MPMYTLHLCEADGRSDSFEAFDLAHDAASFAKAGEILETHPGCDHVEVWQGDRAVVARYRDQPIIRPVAA